MDEAFVLVATLTFSPKWQTYRRSDGFSEALPIHDSIINPGVNMLKKGYSIIRKPSGEIIKNKDVIRDIKAFTAEFSDGIINIEKASFKK